ncbi:MAG: hypothetical protein WD598_05595 [Acidimicrobiia bacterium]
MDKDLTRRQVLARGAGLGFAAAVAPSISRLPLGGLVGGGGLTVVVPEYPFFDGTTMREAPKLLNSLARKYQRSQDSDALVMTRFLFSYVPVTLFDRAFATANPGDELPMGSYLWLFHLSGYFGGVWLRGELSRTGHNAGLTNFSSPQDEEGFAKNVSDADAILDAARASNGKVLKYNEDSLFDKENPEDPEQPERGLIDTFGYNEGYLLQIVDAPPVGLSTPPGFIDCPANPALAPLTCGYLVNRLAALRTFEPIAVKLAGRKGRYADLADRIPSLQEAGIARGRMVWDGLLNVQGFSQEAYEQLLDISSAFLETVQATALASVQAAADGKVAVGRKAATANALLKLWLDSYIVGITDGRPGRALPEFEEQ